MFLYLALTKAVVYVFDNLDIA